MDKLDVLIAGTSTSYLELSKKMLRFHYENCHVDFAYSGNECIDKAASNNYDLVLFDYQLGDKDGLEVIGLLKTLGSEIAMIMLVDEGDEEKGARAVEMGAADFIVKERGYLTALPFTLRNYFDHKGLSKQVTLPEKKIQVVNGNESQLVFDRKGRILAANKTLERLTDYSEEELQELNLADLLPKEQEQQFFEWLNTVTDNGKIRPFETDIVGKKGKRVAFNIVATPVKESGQNVVTYRGKVEHVRSDAFQGQTNRDIDQLDMINRLSHVITTSYDDSLSDFLEKIGELACQVFRFQRATIALLDKRKKMFVKQAMIGYGRSVVRMTRENVEVPQEVISRIFADRFRVKIIYYNQDHRNRASYVNDDFPERRTQKRRPPTQWHKRDLVLVNLLNRAEATFGYVSLDSPVRDALPSRTTFHNLELFGQMVSMAIENFYQFSSVERRSRRLKQILVTSNIFKLYLSLNELLAEVVWSIKFSLDFNLVTLGLISKKSGNLEMKAVACDDKIKLNQLLQLKLPLANLASLLGASENLGKSYFTAREVDVLRPLKQIYHGPALHNSEKGNWPLWGTLLIPIKSRDKKMIGALLVDDPANHKLPSKETVRTLEIMANQIAVAIDNRILYVQTKSRLKELEDKIAMQNGQESQGLKRFIEKFFG